MKISQFLIEILCFFCFVLCSYSYDFYTKQVDKTDSSDSEFIDPVPDYTAFSSHLQYPKIALKDLLEGPMIVHADIDTLGKITEYHFDVSLGPMFEKSVTEALQYISISPAKHKGVAYPISIQLPVEFRIRDLIPKVNFNYHEQILYCLSRLMKIDTTNRSEYLYLRGKEHFKQREYEYANDDYNEYSSLDGTNTKLYYEDAFFQHCSKSLPKDTLHIDSLIKRGEIFANNYLYEKAFDILNQVLTKDSNSRNALLLDADIRTTCKEFEKSNSNYHRLLAISARDTIAYLKIGWNYYMLGNMDKCIEYSEKAIELNKNQFTARFNRALAYLKMGNSEKAKNLYTQTVEMQKSQNNSRTSGEIQDIKDLIHDKIMVSEGKEILKDIFKMKTTEIERCW
jgi:hypothetical protein